MTREEEIHIAASRYIEENSINGYVAISDHKDSFIEGAEWADTHPKSPWISVEDDLPCNHEELLYQKEIIEGTETFNVFAINEYGEIWVDYMVYENGKWRWNDFEPAYWMIAPKLPKEL